MTPSPSSIGSAGSNVPAVAPLGALSRGAGAATLWLPALCVCLPLLIVAARALQDPGDTWGRIVEFRLWDYTADTAILVSLVSLLAVAVGMTCAWLVSAYEFAGRRTLQWLLVLPLGVPGFVAGAAYLDGFEQLAPLFLWLRDNVSLDAFLLSQNLLPWFGSVLVLVFTLFPYVYLSCCASFAGQQADLIEAARLLGCGRRRAFFRIVLPLARPAVVGGAALVAMETANDYGVVTLFGINTLTPGVFRAWSEGSIVSAMRLALILLALIMFVLFLERAQRGRRGYAGDTRQKPLARQPRSGMGAAIIWLVCSIPLVLGFAWPVSRFVRWAMGSAHAANWQSYGSALFNSSWLALLASAMVVASAFWITAGRRAHRLPGGAAVQQLASLGYAIPSALLAVGIGVLISDVSRAPGLSWLALSATASGLVFAYWVRFMAVGIQPVAAAQTRIAGDLHAAARTLGHSASKALFRVDLRLLMPSLAAAAILCFVDIFKELTLTLVMRPFDFETLATLTYRLSSEGRIPEAAVPALVLVGCGMVGVAAIHRMAAARS